MCPPPAPPSSPRLGRRAWLGAAGAGVALAGLSAAWLHYRGHAPWQTASANANANAEGDDMDFCVTSPAVAHDAASGLAPDAPRLPPADTRCPVCGMFPARYPRWAAQVIYTDHHAHFFDSPVDLFQFLRSVERHRPGFSRADILSIWVSDARAEAPPQWLPLESAWLVHGASVNGPMRTPDLPAFASQAEAESFAREHGGQALAAAAISDEIVRSLSSKRNHELHHQIQQENSPKG